MRGSLPQGASALIAHATPFRISSNSIPRAGRAGGSLHDWFEGIQMSDSATLFRSLELIQEAATQVLGAHGSAASQETFCTLMHQQLPTIADDQNPDGNDAQRRKLVAGIDAALRTLATARSKSDGDRARLAMSYARSLRLEIGKLMAAHRG